MHQADHRRPRRSLTTNTAAVLTAMALGGPLAAAGSSVASGAVTAPVKPATAPAAAVIPVPVPVPVPRCSATGLRTTTRYLKQLPPKPQAKAVRILRAAASCDKAALMAIAKTDQTRLSFGIPEPAVELAIPDADRRYRALVILFTRMKPTADRTTGRTTFAWPPLAVKDNRAGWLQVVSTGLLTQREADAMRREVGAYWGWRTWIDLAGSWTSNVSGD